jgi:hypothetical protein
MQSKTDPVHAFQMLYREPVLLQAKSAKCTVGSKNVFDPVCIFDVIDFESKFCRNPPADFMQKHAHKLVGHI